MTFAKRFKKDISRPFIDGIVVSKMLSKTNFYKLEYRGKFA